MAFVALHNNAESDYSIWVSDKGNDDALLHALNQVIGCSAKSLMILACSANEHSSSVLNESLRACPLPLCGGVFPSIFYGSTRMELGFIIVGFPFSLSLSCYQQISQISGQLMQPQFSDGELIEGARDLLVFVDATAPTAEDFISALYESIGGGMDVIGGGAGSLDFKPRPCIFSRAGLLQDVALVVQVPVPMQCALDHGWQVLSGPYLVTEAEGVRLKTINYLPAFDVYKNLLEDISDYRFRADNFFEISQNFPLGIVSVNEEILVRDPVQMLDGSLVCVGRVPVNSMIYILCAKPENIIRAAHKTGARVAEKDFAPASKRLRLALAFDCVSRALYLGGQFGDELDAIQQGLGEQQTLIGVLSIGEIAKTSQGSISLLNKSIVVGHL